MEGEERNTLREALAGCWGLRAEARFRLCEAVVLTLYLSLPNSYMPEKPWLGGCTVDTLRRSSFRFSDMEISWCSKPTLRFLLVLAPQSFPHPGRG